MDQIPISWVAGALGGVGTFTFAIVKWYLAQVWGVTSGLQAQITEQKDRMSELNLRMVQQYVPREELEKHFERFADAQKEITKMLYDGFEELRKEIAHISRNQAQTRILAEGVRNMRGEA